MITRWNGSVTTVLKTHPWEYSFGPMFEAHNKTLFSKLTSEQFEGLGLSIKRNFPDQSLELQGISNEFFHHGHYVSFEYLAAWVYFHELAHVSSLITTANQAKWFKSCSAVLTQDPKDNSIWHGRNMDASPFNVRNVTLQISVVNNIANNMEEIEILFHAADWYWITTGFMTAMKPNLIGLQENWRFIDVNLNDVFTKASKGVLPQVFLFRKTLTEATSMSSYNSIINTLQTIELAAPEYIIASGGNNNGQVIVRELNYTSKVVHIGDQGSFNYLMWTNYDSCLGEPKTDVRCKPGLELLEEMGETLSGSSMGVYAVTSAYPIHNPSTAYTVVMNVKHNVFQTFVRDPLKLVLNYSVSGKDYL
jgi:N-acylethanolamine-hydrolysing acid amidase